MSDYRKPYRDNRQSGDGRPSGGDRRRPSGDERRGPPAERREPSVQTPVQTPPISFYDQAGKLWPDLFDAKAEAWAKRFAGIARSQLRQIFDEAKHYDALATDEKWLELLPFVKMLRSKTAYRVARQKMDNQVAAEQLNALNKFIGDGLDAVKTRKDFHFFCLFFEAIYGFFYERGSADSR